MLHSAVHTLGFPDPLDYLRARDVLAAAGYDSAQLTKKLGRCTAPTAGALPRWLELTRGGKPIDYLVRLFLMGLALDDTTARQALSPMSLESWESAGLVRITGNQVAANVSLTPVEDLVIATDLSDPLHPEHGADHVMGIVPCSLLLAGFAIRQPVSNALDIGCGSGVQALLLSRYAQSFTAIDCSDRALAMGRFNARLNGITNIAWLEGDWLAPVAERQFDQIVCVPPYVISPEAHLLYRDGGRRGDELCRDLLRDAAAHLREGGFCQMIVHCAHVADQSLEERITSWIEGTSCDAWVIRFDTHTPMAYAATWCAAEQKSAADLLERSQAWNAYFQREGIVAISSALITLRRATAKKTWITVKDAPERIAGSAGRAMVAAMEAHDLLVMLDDRQLLQMRLRRSDCVRLTQELGPTAGGWSAISSRLALCSEWVYSCRTDGRVAELVARCDGESTLGEILVDVASSLRVAVEDLTRVALPVVRELVEFGFLLPVGERA